MRSIFLKLAAILLLLGVAVISWGWHQYNRFADEPLTVSAEGTELKVAPGATFTLVAKQLQAQGVIRDALLYRIMVRLHGKGRGLKAGDYFITAGTTPRQLFQQLMEGRVRQYSMTIIEGWSFRQMMQAVNGNPYLSHSLGGLTDKEVMSRIGVQGVHPEGRFFPDTYHFPRGFSDVELLRHAFDAMNTRLAHEWSQRDVNLPLKSDYEALILASIVEKETGQASERPMIAGVFIRRLQLGMRLQTDPTVIYGLGETFDGNLRRRDLEAENPYNTYRIKGLPPTPIAMPGGDALRAALHPAPGKELYFVARGNGSHHFSATYEEHDRAVKEFQLKRRTQ